MTDDAIKREFDKVDDALQLILVARRLQASGVPESQFAPLRDQRRIQIMSKLNRMNTLAKIRGSASATQNILQTSVPLQMDPKSGVIRITKSGIFV